MHLYSDRLRYPQTRQAKQTKWTKTYTIQKNSLFLNKEIKKIQYKVVQPHYFFSNYTLLQQKHTSHSLRKQLKIYIYYTYTHFFLTTSALNCHTHPVVQCFPQRGGEITKSACFYYLQKSVRLQNHHYKFCSSADGFNYFCITLMFTGIILLHRKTHLSGQLFPRNLTKGMKAHYITEACFGARLSCRWEMRGKTHQKIYLHCPDSCSQCKCSHISSTI